MNRSTSAKNSSLNPMLRPRVGKVVVNISVGQSGEPLEKAMRVLEILTGQKPCKRAAKKTIKDWGIRKREPMACIVTLRGQRTMEFLKRVFEAVGSKLSASSFDPYGNFAFGIKEHIEIPGVKYDPKLGIFGMDVCVSMEKPGYRVKRKRRVKSKVGKRQKLTREEAINYVKETFGVKIL